MVEDVPHPQWSQFLASNCLAFKNLPFFVFIFLPLFNLSYLLGLGFLNLFLDLSKLWILSSCLFVFMSCCVCRKFPNKTNIKAAQSFKYFRVGRILLVHFSNITLFNVQWICKKKRQMYLFDILQTSPYSMFNPWQILTLLPALK